MKKTLTVEEDTWKSLSLMKLAMAVNTIDDVINKLILSYNLKSKGGKKDGMDR